MESISYRGYEIEFSQDGLTEGPREWENLGTMVCFHRNYNLGDKHNFSDADDLREFLKENDCIYLPLYLYDHSGITMNTSGFSCPWDSGRVGIIYVEKEQVRKEFGWKRITQDRREKIYKTLRQEVKTYDQYLTGDVWGYSVEGVSSCYGFYGTEYMIEEAKSAIDYHIEKRRKEHQVRVKELISNQVPLFKREEILSDTKIKKQL